TRYGTVGLSLVQATAMSIGLNAMTEGMLIEDPNALKIIIIALVLTSGTAFLIWLVEQITANGVANGISILVLAGIVAAVPEGVILLYSRYFGSPGSELFLSIVLVALVVLVVLAVTAGVVYIQQAERKIPIEYAKRLVNRSPVGGQT